MKLYYCGSFSYKLFLFFFSVFEGTFLENERSMSDLIKLSENEKTQESLIDEFDPIGSSATPATG